MSNKEKGNLNLKGLNVNTCRRYLTYHKVNIQRNWTPEDYVNAMQRHLQHLDVADDNFIFTTFYKVLADRHSQNLYPPSARKSTKKRKPTQTAKTSKPKKAKKTTSAQAKKNTTKKKEKKKPAPKKKKQVSSSESDSESESESDSDSDSDGSAEKYCICNDVSYGIMITCDGARCKRKKNPNWYHLACVGLRKTPIGKWLCPECTKPKSNSKDSTTYAFLIVDALETIAKTKGKPQATFVEICDMIQKRAKRKLNWQEQTNRKQPVWKCSVRKVLLGSKLFQRSSAKKDTYILKKS